MTSAESRSKAAWKEDSEFGFDGEKDAYRSGFERADEEARKELAELRAAVPLVTSDAKVCDECGSLVSDAAKHDGWHYEMRSDMGALWLALRDLEDR